MKMDKRRFVDLGNEKKKENHRLCPCPSVYVRERVCVMFLTSVDEFF